MVKGVCDSVAADVYPGAGNEIDHLDVKTHATARRRAMRGHLLAIPAASGQLVPLSSALRKPQQPEARPERAPQRRGYVVDHEHDAAPVHEHATRDAEDALAHALQAPAL